MRDHQPIILEKFNGLWQRDDAETCPIDHFPDCNNIQFIQDGFKTRDGIDTYVAKGDVLRMYNYVMNDGESLLILDIHGSIYHSINQTTLYGPILTIPEMTDFGFVAIFGRAYITPFTTYPSATPGTEERGLSGEFLYVYKGDGTPARKAAGPPPSIAGTVSFIAVNSGIDGVVTKGIHLIAVAFDGGVLGPEVFPVVLAPGDKEIVLFNIPTLGGVTRTIVMTHAIDVKDYDPDQTTYTYYEVQDIADDTVVSISINPPDSALTVVYAPGVGSPPISTALLAENSETDGHVDYGFRLIGVVYETDTGYLTKPGPESFAGVTAINIKKGIDVSNIPVSPDTFVTKRHLISTRVIPEYNGDQVGFQFFFIPDGTIDDNTTTTKFVSYYNDELIDDASHLLDNFTAIDAGVALNTYHGRLILTTQYGSPALARLSAVGEPEAISEVDGFITAPRDGKPLTNAQEFRDVLYLFKDTKTFAVNDNGGEPATWPLIVLDQGIGSSVHGVATVLDSGGVNIDFLLIVDFSGVMLFDGVFKRPELSWKIKTFWFSLPRDQFHKIQILNNSLDQRVFISLPVDTENRMLEGNYANALNPKDIRWTPLSFDIEPTTIALVETNKLLIGARAAFVPPVPVVTPIIIAITRLLPSPTALGAVTWQVTFNVAVTGVTAANFTLVPIGLTETSILSVSGSGTTWIVQAATGGGTGSIGLNLSNPTGILSTLGVPLTAVFTGEVYAIERSAPVVVTVTRNGSQIAAAGSQVSWSVLFSQNVINVDLTDFALAQVGITGSSLVSVSGINTSYVVVANVGTANGSLGLNVLNNGTVRNEQDVPLAAGFTGQVYTIQSVPAAPSNMRNTFVSNNRVNIAWNDNSSNETGFEIERRVASGSFLFLASVGPNVVSYIDTTVSPSTFYTYRIRAVNTIGNSAYATGNQFQTPSASANPTVQSINRTGTDPTNAATGSWLATFSEPVAGVTTGAFSLVSAGVTGSPAITNITPTGGNSYVVTASFGSGGVGTVQLNLSTVAGITSVATGLPLLATFSGQFYSVDRVAPTVTSINRASTNPTTTGATVIWDVVLSESCTGVVLANFAIAGVAGTILSLTGSGATYTVTAQVGSSTGSFGLNLIP